MKIEHRIEFRTEVRLDGPVVVDRAIAGRPYQLADQFAVTRVVFQETDGVKVYGHRVKKDGSVYSGAAEDGWIYHNQPGVVALAHALGIEATYQRHLRVLAAVLDAKLVAK